ncbi:MAG: hypothetical protein RLZZ299_1075 [Pseudomonadota bacterium]
MLPPRALLLATLTAGCTDSSGVDTAGEGTPDPCPPGMALVGAFCIDTVETTVEGERGNADQGTAWPDGSTTAVARPVHGVVPSVQLSWYQAWAACDNAGKHLCTVEEWNTACSPEGWTYPWGDSPAGQERCPLASNDNVPATDALQPTASYPGCVSPQGVHDMVGNAWEWADPGETADDGRPVTAKLGGAHYHGGGSGLCGDPPHTEHPPEFDGSIAARCCVAPSFPPDAEGR